MKKVLAISGGIDSMLMLSMMAQGLSAGGDGLDAYGDVVAPDFGMVAPGLGAHGDVVVAHYNHKMRPSADADAEFVRHWAEDIYQVPFYYGEAEPSEIKSEEQARKKRYEFLHKVAAEKGGAILTAHHINDLAETVAINLLRGTGWRGLAPFSDNRTHQFFFEFPHSKREIYDLAEMNGVVFRQDPTNNEDDYLRNRVREKLSSVDDDFLGEIWDMYIDQLQIEEEVDKIIAELLPADGKYKREWFSALDHRIAIEILRAGLLRVGISATRPQLMDFLLAIKKYAPEKKFNLPGGKMVVLHKTYFVLKPEDGAGGGDSILPQNVL